MRSTLTMMILKVMYKQEYSKSYSYKLIETSHHLALPSFAPPSWGKVLVCFIVKPEACGSGWKRASTGYLLQPLHCHQAQQESDSGEDDLKSAAWLKG